MKQSQVDATLLIRAENPESSAQMAMFAYGIRIFCVVEVGGYHEKVTDTTDIFLNACWRGILQSDE